MKSRLIAFCAVGCLGAFSQAGLIEAATFEVHNETELQSALLTARNNGEDDTINVHAAFYKVSNNGNNPFRYVANNTENKKLSIIGDGMATTILDGELTKQVMSIDTNAVVGDAEAAISVQGLTFLHGTLSGAGAGLAVLTTDADIAVDGCSFESSKVTTGGSPNIDGGGGGAVFFSDGSGNIMVTNSHFKGNEAKTLGGGFVAVSFNGNARVDRVLMSNNSVTGNASSAGGGAVVFLLGGKSEVTNNIFSENSAQGSVLGGGGLVVGGLVADVLHNDFYNNFSSMGGGLSVGAQDCRVANNIFLDNTALSGDGDDVFFDDTSPDTTRALFNNMLSEACLMSGSCDLTALGDNQGGNLLDIDPLFVDVANGDFRLKEGSPAINVANADFTGTLDVDFEGNPRVNGPLADLGAIEADACGNNVVEVGEECDAGVDNSDTSADACRTNCLNPFCGDGALDSTETCDDGNTVDDDGCSATCQEEVTSGGTDGTTGGDGGSSGGCSLVR